METPLILLCPGQGAQFVGMGKAWFDASPEARAVFEKADALLGNRLGGGAKLTDLCFSGPADRLNATDVSQPAIFVTSVACWKGLLAKWNCGNGEAKLAAAAGLSLGEYTALHIAGAFSFEDGLELVTLRGRAMQDAAEAAAKQGVGGGSGMVALIGADEAQAAKICEQARGPDVLVCANFNAPGQIVLSGHSAACARAAEVASGMGLRATVLQVAGAFHSPLMAPAAERLKQALARTTITNPRCPVVSNVTGMPHAGGGAGVGGGSGGTMADQIRARLVEQLTSPVRWADGCLWLAGNIKGQAHELAPGKTLAGLMRRIDRDFKVVNHDEPSN
jgi:[acyl-carrier-protein] S-malonyltransferase